MSTPAHNDRHQAWRVALERRGPAISIPQVHELRDMLVAPSFPAAYKMPGIAMGMALKDGPHVRLGALLAAAIGYARIAVALELRDARARAGITRGELAVRVKRSPRYVGRAERGEAVVDVAYRAEALRACRRRSGPRRER